MSISLCCFSRNRPCQLDLFLRSLDKVPYAADPIVLYTFDDQRFEEGYELVQQYHPNVRFIKEVTNREWWKNTIIELVESFEEYFMWSTDDSIFYKHSELTDEKLNWAFKEQNAKSIALRVGLNLQWQNHWHSERTPVIPVKDRFQDLITWDSSNISTENDIGRIWQNDASIMPRDEYVARLKIEDNWYKTAGCRGLDGLGQSGNIFNPRIGCCFEESVYVNMPVNLVHYLPDGVRLYADNWGKFIQQDVFMLNHKFVSGQRIVMPEIDTIDCGRIEIEYEFGSVE